MNASLTKPKGAWATTPHEINSLPRAAAEGPIADILGYEERPLVSADCWDDASPSIVDTDSTPIADGVQGKFLL